MSRRRSKIKNIDYALVAKGHSPMYVMHKYWARKPHNVVSEYIKNYTGPNDIVFDPFVGSGVTALEAVKLGRRAIGIDLNPMSIFISRMTGKPADIDEIKEAFELIAADCKAEIESFYQTECPKCGSPATVLAGIWDRRADKLTEVRYACARCKKRSSKKPSKADLTALAKLNKRPIKTWYPKDEFPKGITFAQGRREAGPHFYDLFTKRNLRALSLLWASIQEVPNEATREFMSFAFTSMVHLASKMTPVRPSRPFSSFWAINSYWIPPDEYMESNVWLLYDNAVNHRQGLIPAKEDSNDKIKKWREAKKFSELNEDANVFLKVHNTLELEEILPQNSVDYVFTDPPYGGAVPYAELSTLWALWKGFKVNYDDEITINDDKNFEYYHKMLQAAFRQVHRVLKSGGYLTVTFHSTDIKVWNSIINAVVLAGFDLEKIVYQPPARPSAKGLLVPYGSAVGDYYIRFRRPEHASTADQHAVSEENYDKAVVEAAKKILAERGEPTAYTYILNGIIVELKKAGVLLGGKKNPNQVMKTHVGKDFVLVDEKDKEGKVLGKKWWFTDPAAIPYLDLVPLSDRLETAIVDVLHRKVKVSFDDALQEVFMKFPNALTPETQKVSDLLDEYADQTKDGKWALKPIVQARESEHNKMIAILLDLGKKAGYSVSVGTREQSEVYDGKKLGSLASGSPDLTTVPEVNADRIRQIDVIWFSNKGIQAVFEVENTTAITEAIVRGSNLPLGTIKRFIVLPEERERLLHRKLQEPMLAERMKQEPWSFIYYKDLVELHDYRKKGKMSLAQISKITTQPTLRNKQLGLGFAEDEDEE